MKISCTMVTLCLHRTTLTKMPTDTRTLHMQLTLTSPCFLLHNPLSFHLFLLSPVALSVDVVFLVNVLNRAHNFLALLQTDPELVRMGAEPHMYLAVAVASTLHPANASKAGIPVRPNQDSLADVEMFLSQACWGPADHRVALMQVQSIIPPRAHLGVED